MAYRLKLKKALSYTGIVSASKSNPYVDAEDKETAEKAVATGYFEIISEETAEEADVAEHDVKELEDMTISELETFATYKGVVLKGISKKADIIQKLKEELEKEETEGEVDYGSPTVLELQES